MPVKRHKCPTKKASSPAASRKQKVRASRELVAYSKTEADLEYLKKVAKDLLKNVQIEDMLTLEEYYVQLPFSDASVERWPKRCPELYDAQEKAKKIIGIRREKGIIQRGLEPRYTAYCLHNYLPRWKEANKYHDKRKQEQDKDAAKQNITWVLQELGSKSTSVLDTSVKDTCVKEEEKNG